VLGIHPKRKACCCGAKLGRGEVPIKRLWAVKHLFDSAGNGIIVLRKLNNAGRADANNRKLCRDKEAIDGN
jgi:hypothetical protein